MIKLERTSVTNFDNAMRGCPQSHELLGSLRLLL